MYLDWWHFANLLLLVVVLESAAELNQDILNMKYVLAVLIVRLHSCLILSVVSSKAFEYEATPFYCISLGSLPYPRAVPLVSI